MSVTRACAVCGAEFEPRTSGKYCCAECRRVAKSRQDRERMARRRGAPRTYEPRTCDVCGREFTPHSYQQLRCSPDCMYEANLRLGRETYRRERERAMAEAEKPQLPHAPHALTSQERLRIGALVGTGRATAWDLAKKLRTDVADVLRMRDEWRRWRHGVETMRAVRA